ncbi:LysR family transcriptional regulator [Furfurilactobacillus sp. WILCCON 0119]
MNTRDLEYFMAVANQQNFSAVAAQFNVSQPTITVAIKRLEKEFGDVLVQRDRTHALAKLTTAGVILQTRAEIMLQNLTLAQREIAQSRATTIRFGLPPIIGTIYFPKLAGRLLSDNILSHLRTREAGSDKLLQELEDGEIDVALLGSVRPLQNQTLTTTLLAQRPFKVIVGRNHRLATQKTVSFSELAEENFVTLTDNFIHPEALQKFAAASGIEPHVIYKSPDIPLIKGLVAEGLAVSLLVGDAIFESDDVVALEISDPLTMRFNISVAYRKGFVPTTAQQRFIDDLALIQ